MKTRMLPRNRRFVVGWASFAAVLSVVALSSATAPAGRYTISAGSVLDSKTGLTWQQTVPTMMYTTATAPPYCASLGAGWRLPTVKELATIVDYTVASPGPLIDAATFPSTPTDAVYVSATRFASNGNWIVDFHDGTICDNCGPDSTPLRVRCVH